MAIIPRHVIRFRDLKIGDHFRFAESTSFFRTAKKITSRCYVWADARVFVRAKGGGWRDRAGVLRSCVGTVNVKVEPTGRGSPVRRRRGRGRGPGQMAGFRRRY